MTRYALLTEFFPPEHGGIQASLGPLADLLGTDLTIVAPGSGEVSDRRVFASLFSGTGWPRWWWLVGWLKHARKQGLQYVIFGHFSTAVLAGWVANRVFGLPYVLFIHGNDLLTEERRWLTRMFIRLLLRHATLIGVNSNFVYERVQRYAVPASQIIFSHPFVLSARLTASLPPTTRGRRLITVARLVPRKNVRAIITALSALKHQWPDIHLDIVGDGPERVALEQQTASLGLNKEVTFHGPVSEEEKWRLLQAADIFVMTPTVRDHGTDVEGLGLVYLEAMAAGLPVVASATGGIRDAVKDGVTGLVVDPHDPESLTHSIRRLLEHPDLATQLAVAGQTLVADEYTDRVRIGRLVRRLAPATEQPLVSVIIPAYQAAETIAATLESVRKQTYPHLEIIVVNDGSTDNLEATLEPFQRDIMYFKQTNAGAPTARNAGFDRSRGNYVLFLDADVTLTPNAMTEMVEVLETRPDIDFVYSNFYFGWKKFRLHNFDSSALRRMNFIHTTSLLRRSVFPRFDPQLKKFQDWDLWLTLDEQRHFGVWIDRTLFRVHPRQANIGISTWLPSIMYRLPFIGQGKGSSTIARYRSAEQVIRKKHRC